MSYDPMDNPVGRTPGATVQIELANGRTNVVNLNVILSKYIF